MITTTFQAQLQTERLLCHHTSNDVENIAKTLVHSTVDINPHQIEAALFATRSPLSHGVILADEVGLGKTIEAGIILSQKWAEKKRRILIIPPSSLRKQWEQEIYEKFYLPSQIIDSQSFKTLTKEGVANPFLSDKIVICSYEFARCKHSLIKAISWDLVIFDEAHRLRNVFKKSVVTAKTLLHCTAGAERLLLTATPLQNNIDELFGLVNFIDGYIFGDLKVFRKKYTSMNEQAFNELKDRLKPICHRTLRKHVLSYIQFPERITYTQEFTPSSQEDEIYKLVSEYLQRPKLNSLPNSQRMLITLIMRKLLASSTFAIAGALQSLAEKLKIKLEQDSKLKSNLIKENTTEIEDFSTSEIANDFEGSDELIDEYDEDDSGILPQQSPQVVSPTTQTTTVPLSYSNNLLTDEQRQSIQDEIIELEGFVENCKLITENTKAYALLQALQTGFEMAQQHGGIPKALVFTESRKTQEYLIKFLLSHGYSDEDLILFNGTNKSPKSNEVYQQWKSRHSKDDNAPTSKNAEMRAALVEHFRERAKIMIATEAAAEGINLQFCSLIINYDLPWNPQRIEQRIGRCHRYGQKHDVVVVNFLNKNNAADQRVLQLLTEKFKLFDGVFGSSDEILGSIGSGVDFERRILDIYQRCRTEDEIQHEFDQLRDSLKQENNERMQKAKQMLFESFDEDVVEKLQARKSEIERSIDKNAQILWEISRYILREHAHFNESTKTFRLISDFGDIKASPIQYSLQRSDNKANIYYTFGERLAKAVLQTARTQPILARQINIDYSHSEKNIAAIASLVNKSGLLSVLRFSHTAYEKQEKIVVVAQTDDNIPLDDEQIRWMIEQLPVTENVIAEKPTNDKLQKQIDQKEDEIKNEIYQHLGEIFDETVQKLDLWEADQKEAIDLEIKHLTEEIQLKRNQRKTLYTIQQKLENQKEVAELEQQLRKLELDYFDAKDRVEAQKKEQIKQTEDALKSEATEMSELFTVHWTLL